MHSFLAELFAIKKRRYLKTFEPRLNIRARNSIRIPGYYAGSIASQYQSVRKMNSYRDKRDYLTDLALRGLSKLSSPVSSRQEFDVKRIYDVKHRYTEREHVVKVDLAFLDLARLSKVSRSLINIDLYDLVSILIIVGQDEVNGGIRYVERGYAKIYS